MPTWPTHSVPVSPGKILFTSQWTSLDFLSGFEWESFSFKGSVNECPTNHDRISPDVQMDEEKKNYLAIRIQPLNLTGLGVQELRAKASDLWEKVVKLETEKFDLEVKV